MQNQVFETNCSIRNTYYKTCYSYGVVLLTVHPTTGRWHVILTERSHSYAFVEYLRGKFVLNDDEKSHNKSDISLMFNRMTLQERSLLNYEQRNFESLYRSVFVNTRKPNLLSESLIRNKLVDVKQCLDSTSSIYDHCEIGFPKGRKNRNEDPLAAAIREVYEETGIPPNQYKLVNVDPLFEVHNASNNVKYKSTYYVAIMNQYTDHFPLGFKQLEETKQVLNVPVDNLPVFFRDYEEHKFRSFHQLCVLLASDPVFSSK